MINNIKFPGLGLEFEISRSLFSVFGIDVYTYGLIIGLGVILGFIYAAREVEKQGISQDDFLNMFLIGVPAAIVCARLYYVIFSWDLYKNNLMDIFDIRGGGIAIYGGVIGAAVSVLIYCKKKKLNAKTVFDILAVGLLIGQAVGRWGNFVNGEAYGVECTLPWRMIVNGVSAHPAFLYESLWLLLGFIIIWSTRKIKPFPGRSGCFYLIWYGVERAFVELLRTDSLMLYGVRVSSVLSLVLVIIGVVGYFRLKKSYNSFIKL